MTCGEFNIIPIKMGNSNAYIVIGNNLKLLVDAGSQGHIQNLETVLSQNGLNVSDLDLVIVTHSHYDHVGNLAEIKKRSNAKVFVHVDEFKFLNDGYTPVPKGTTAFSETISWVANRFSSSRIRYDPVNPDFLIDGDCELLKAPGINILTTPGHTLGSICVIINDEHAIVGDTLFNVFTNCLYPPFADYKCSLIGSWEKLLATRCKNFYPGHGKPIPFAKLRQCLSKINEP